MIRILEDALVNQIAAGEVVERPASVVKELVENSLDAGAKGIRVTLRDGGRSMIRVIDDGSGMDRDDALMCLERHATSKIRTADDLAAVGTLGFRGEAIPSIASVSRFQLVTRRGDDDVGTTVRVDGGRLLDVADAGAAPGADISVRSLFYNVPVRRKFLRTGATELGHCVEAVLRQALCRPDVHFEVHHDDREALLAPVAADKASRARSLLGEHGAALVPVDFRDDGVGASGLVSPVGVHKGTHAGSTYLYVNGRFVRDPVLRRAVADAYRGIVPKGRYPVVVLELTLDPAEVDVNVHPTKIEVRFRNPRDVTSIVADGLRAALQGHGIRRPVDRAGPAGYPPSEAAQRDLPLAAHPDDDPWLAARGVVDRAPPPLPADWEPPPPAWVAREPDPVRPGPGADPLLPVARYRDLRVIGQFVNTYILCEGGGELVIVDQHAAHERVMLHHLRRDPGSRLGSAQRLLTPRVVELPRGRASVLRDHLDALDALKLEVEPFGPTGFAVKSIPALLDKVDLVRLFDDLATEAVHEGQARAGEAWLDHVLATMACHSAVRARDPLTDYEMRSLLAALDEVDFSVCAHGRPVAILLSEHELEHRFHRT